MWYFNGIYLIRGAEIGSASEILTSSFDGRRCPTTIDLRSAGEPFTRRKTMEQKSSHSTRIPKSGSISFGRSKADCSIRSISAYGAALDLAKMKRFPTNSR
jgi:hypothetical protein